jgi:hypothetical protein
MPLPTKVVANQGTLVEVQLLPDGQRSLPNYTITNTAPAPINSTTITVTPTTVFLQAETHLNFGSVDNPNIVVLVNDAPVGTSQLTVQPLTAALPAGDDAVTLGLLQLLGVTDASVNSASTTVDTSNFQSGYGMESLVTALDRTVSISLNQIEGDRALDTIIKRLAFDDAFATREVYARVTRPNRESFEGAAQVRNVNQPTAMRDIAKLTFELQFQGSKTFRHVASKTYAAV